MYTRDPYWLLVSAKLEDRRHEAECARLLRAARQPRGSGDAGTPPTPGRLVRLVRLAGGGSACAASEVGR